MSAKATYDIEEYQWQIRNFNTLTKQELYEILKFRMEIFIVEQNSIYLDLDNMDQQAIHFLVNNKRQLIAYGRISFGESETMARIRRVSVRKDYRNKYLGTMLMKKMLEFIDTQSTVSSIELDAQHHLQAFYEKHGFSVSGLPYDDGGILHINMSKHLER